MLELVVNGSSRGVASACCLDKALQEWGYTSGHFAVAVNGAFVPKSRYSEVALSSGDAVEVLSPMQGG